MAFVPKSFGSTKQGPNYSSCHSSGALGQKEKRREAQRKSESEVAQPCLTLSGPVNCSLPGSSVHGIFQGRVLEWVSIKYIHLGPIKVKRKEKVPEGGSQQQQPVEAWSAWKRRQALEQRAGQRRREERQSKGPKLQASPPEWLPVGL